MRDLNTQLFVMIMIELIYSVNPNLKKYNTL